MYAQSPYDDAGFDPYAVSQFEQQTQQTQQASQSQVVPEAWDDTLWGILTPFHHLLPRIFFKKERTSVSIGRGHENDVALKSLKISNRHCVLTWDGTRNVLVRDTSSNGTWINGSRIGRGMTAMLQEGNEIIFGPYSQAMTPDNHRYIFRYLADGLPQGGVHKYYDIGTEIGHGSFATVYRAVGREDGQLYAIKMISRNRLRTNSESASNVFLKEIAILEPLRHPNICQLKATFQETDSIVLVLEYVGGGDLLDYIISRGGLSEGEARRLTFQLCKALKYIHARSIAHRDLKPENILMTKDDPPNLKLADFGLAKAVDSVTQFRTMCGTPIYLAPEVILRDSRETYSHKVDSWSVGVIVFAMIANAQPFLDDDASVIAIRFRRRYIDWPLVESHNISPDCRNFLDVLLEENPAERLSCTDALRHPWLAPLSASEPEALDDPGNDSIFSVMANAGSFTEMMSTPRPPPHEPLAKETPASQELRSTGITGNFEQIRMDEAPPPETEAVSEIQPCSRASQGDPSADRSPGRRLERRPMQIAEFDASGHLTPFHPFAAGSADPSPVLVGDVKGNGNGMGSDAQSEGDPVSPTDKNAETGSTARKDENGTAEGVGNAEPVLSSTPGTDTENGNEQASTSNARKRSAPGSQESENASMHDEAPTKRTRAISADVAA
ncbi:hypothetical protein ACEPAH_7094 [Sanghuangporus vaninii]